MDKPIVMILGAGVYQIPAIKKAKSLGYKTIVLSYNIDQYPGSKIADIALEVDTTDIKHVVYVAKKYNVNGILTTGTDVALPALGKVNDEMHLIGPTYESCILSTNKILMKQAFKKCNVPTSKYFTVNSFKEAEKSADVIGYPLMVKAIKSSGSRGISKVESKERLKEAWEYAHQYSETGDPILIEEYLHGIEFGAQAFIFNNQVRLICPHNDTLTPPPHCTPIGHSYPLLNSSSKENKIINSICVQGMKALKMDNCAANIDLIKTKDGIKILEIGARMGATCCPELTEVFTGIDVTKECIKMAMGEVPDFTIHHQQPTAALLLRSSHSGIIRRISIPETVQNDPDIIEISLDICEKDTVNAFVIGPDRIGHIIVKGNNVKYAERKVELLANQIIIDIIQES